MSFIEILHTLKPIIGGGDSTHLFTRKIFEILLTEEGLWILEGISENTFKAYYNRNTNISKISRRMALYIEPEQMIHYFNGMSDATIELLTYKLQLLIPDITISNAPERISHYLVETIIESASQERSIPSTKANKPNPKHKPIANSKDSSDNEGYDNADNPHFRNGRINIQQSGNHNLNFINNGNIVLNIGNKKEE